MQLNKISKRYCLNCHRQSWIYDIHFASFPQSWYFVTYFWHVPLAVGLILQLWRSPFGSQNFLELNKTKHHDWGDDADCMINRKKKITELTWSPIVVHKRHARAHLQKQSFSTKLVLYKRFIPLNLGFRHFYRRLKLCIFCMHALHHDYLGSGCFCDPLTVVAVSKVKLRIGHCARCAAMKVA